MDIQEYENLDPFKTLDSPAGPVQFSTPNRAAAWRVETFFTKEPDTLEWIAEFAPGAVFVDIGANVGMYTIWAAKTRGVQAYAFEPESQNFALLNKNIVRNALGENVRAYCASLSDTVGFGLLTLSGLMAAGSVHQFSSDPGKKRKPSAYLQGSYGSTLDTLVADGVIPVPAHVKIDVDGIEPRIVRGALKTFADPHVRSVLIEVDTGNETFWEMIDLMLGLGFDYQHDQVNRALRKEGPFEGVGNYVFRR